MARNNIGLIAKTIIGAFAVALLMVCSGNLLLKIIADIKYGAQIYDRIVEKLINFVSEDRNRDKLDEWLNSRVPSYISDRPLAATDTIYYLYDFDYKLLGISEVPGLSAPVTIRYSPDGKFELVNIPWGSSGIIITNKSDLGLLGGFVKWHEGRYYVYSQK